MTTLSIVTGFAAVATFSSTTTPISLRMSPREDAYARHQQARWLRPDAARYLAPNADIGAIFPAIERKYSTDQPHVPAGNPDGGQWTDGSISGNPGLFQIKPREQRTDGVQLAGEPPPGIGHNGGPSIAEPPRIPKKMPETRDERMGFVRAAVEWAARAARLGIAVGTYFELLDQVADIKRLTDAIKSANDPPGTLQELQDRARLENEAGYENHHIVNQHNSNLLRFGLRINDPENVVRIPVVKHYKISGWYSKPNEEFGGLSPREYLRDKSWDEQTEVGLKLLRKFEVLK